MSLRGFHLFFISVSIVCAFGFAAWCLKQYSSQLATSDMVSAVISSVAGVGLIVYGVKVRKKLKNVGTL